MQWNRIQQSIVSCQRCPRLRMYCQAVAQEKRAAFRDQEYWGRPVPNFGTAAGRLLIVGLAPAAHGANRTGRMFTGDRSGDFLFSAMFAEGFANQPTSVDAKDGLELIDAAMTATAHCAPPENKPTPGEIANCTIHFERTVDAMPNLVGMLALGKIAFDTCIRLYRERGWIPTGERWTFGHGALYPVGPEPESRPAAKAADGATRRLNALAKTSRPVPFLLASYHPSQQNTFTGKLTPDMMRKIFADARRRLGEAPAHDRRQNGHR